MNITGTGNLDGSLKFTASARLLNNFTLNRTSTGIATLGTDLAINGIATMTNGALVINGNTISLNGTLTGTGTFTGSSTSAMTVGGTTGGNLGTLYFTAGAQLLNLFTMNRSGASGRAIMGTNISMNNITLTKRCVSHR